MSDQTSKVMDLRPVNFTYKTDESRTMQYGLIAEEVAKIYPEFIAYDSDGVMYSINYMAFIPILLAQIQRLEKQDQEKQSSINEYQQQIQHHEVLLEEQSKQIQELKNLLAQLLVKFA